jgi:hypothetical protein
MSVLHLFFFPTLKLKERVPSLSGFDIDYRTTPYRVQIIIRHGIRCWVWIAMPLHFRQSPKKIFNRSTMRSSTLRTTPVGIHLAEVRLAAKDI